MINKLINFFKKKERWDVEFEKHNIKKAFVLEGVQYYTFCDLLEIPHRRGLVAMEYSQDVQAKITKDVLELALRSIKTALNQRIPDIVTASSIVSDLEERNKWIIETETFFKLASVFFFTDKEDPNQYDFAFNKKKIQVFIEKSDSFFLQGPLKILAPSLQLSPADTLIYLAAKCKKTKSMLSSILESQNSANISSELKAELESKLLNLDYIMVHLLQSANTLQSLQD